jgi:hypothetical protein
MALPHHLRAPPSKRLRRGARCWGSPSASWHPILASQEPQICRRNGFGCRHSRPLGAAMDSSASGTRENYCHNGGMTSAPARAQTRPPTAAEVHDRHPWPHFDTLRRCRFAGGMDYGGGGRRLWVRRWARVVSGFFTHSRRFRSRDDTTAIVTPRVALRSRSHERCDGAITR